MVFFSIYNINDTELIPEGDTLIGIKFIPKQVIGALDEASAFNKLLDNDVDNKGYNRWSITPFSIQDSADGNHVIIGLDLELPRSEITNACITELDKWAVQNVPFQVLGGRDTRRLILSVVVEANDTPDMMQSLHGCISQCLDKFLK